MSEAHYRNLAVPFLSQRKNNYVFTGKYDLGKAYDARAKFENDDHLIYNTPPIDEIKSVSMANRSCNITCIAMILYYFGITNDTPDTMMERYFTSTDTYSTIFAYKSVMAFESWDNMYDFVEKTYEGLCTPKLLGKCTIADLKKNIEAGYPVMLSLGAINIGSTSGHIVVVRGFTEIDGDEYIIFNDPWGSSIGTNNELVRGTTVYAYYNDLLETNGANGDNLVLKVSEFTKLIVGGKTMHMAMVIYGPLWQNLNGTESSNTDTNFPINSKFMWHNGIHLNNFTSNEIRSIGAGRLLAVRNKNVANGSASFMLVQHNIAPITKTEEEIEIGISEVFYALYMHTECIDIESCAKMYFETGRLPTAYNYKWLLQLFSNMLPHVYVISNLNFRIATGGQLNDTYANQKIYEARIIENHGLAHTDVKSEEFHGQRMLVHVLPINQVFQKLLKPQNYLDADFLRQMLNPKNFIKEVKNGRLDEKYIFFHSYDASTESTESTEPKIFCSQVFEDDFFTKPFTINGKMFKRNAKKLSQLYNDGSENSGTVVSFNDLENLPKSPLEGVYASIKDATTRYLDQRTSIFTFTGAPYVSTFAGLLKPPYLVAQRAHWDRIFQSRRTDDTPTATDNFFTAMASISLDFFLSDGNTKRLYHKLREYFNDYKIARYNQLKTFLDNLLEETSTSTDARSALDKKNWRDHLKNTLIDCFPTITDSSESNPSTAFNPKEDLFKDVNEGSGKEISTLFLTSLQELLVPLDSAEIAIEKACCRVCSIHKDDIEDSDSFKTTDNSIITLLTGYSDLLEKNFKSFITNYKHYVDTVIEIAKDEVIGKCGSYYWENNMIHFEIFSGKNIDIYKKLGRPTDGLITDESIDNFFNRHHIIEVLETYGEISCGSHTFLEMEKDTFSKYALKHISQWSPLLTHEKFDRYHNFFDETSKNYFKECSIPYQWSLDKIISKIFFSNDIHTYYHPVYFLLLFTPSY